MDSLFQQNNDKNINWRSFLWFLLLMLIIGVLIIYFVFPSIFKGPEAIRIPVIPREEPRTKVDIPIINLGDIREISARNSKAVITITSVWEEEVS